MRITPEVKAFAMQQAGRRCECTGSSCRHHLKGARCKRGLRGDQWKVFWKSEGGGLTRDNLQAWCLECFANNYEAPRETVALLAAEVAGYARLIEEDRRRAITLKSVLRDAADRAAKQHRGRLVLDRLDDDVLVEFPSSPHALEAARSISVAFQEIAQRLELTVPGISGAIHCGEVTRWRNGLLRGEAVDITMTVRSVAGLGRIVLTEAAIAPLKGSVELEQLPADVTAELPVGGIWLVQL